MIKNSIYSLLVFIPLFVFAAVDLTIVNGLLTFIKSVVSNLTPIFFGLALVYFFWGVAMYVRNAGDPKKASEGKTMMIHGVIAIAVMASIFGLIVALQDLFSIHNVETPLPVIY